MGEPYNSRIAELMLDGRLNETHITPEQITAALEGTSVTLPNNWLPSLIPFVSLLSLFCLHALLMLMQVWSIKFNAWLNYSETNNYKLATHAMAIPHVHCGKAEIVPVIHSPENDHFIFQRHKFLFNDAGNGKYNLQKVKPYLKKPAITFMKAEGLQTEEEVHEALNNYGENIFSVSSPTFKELYLQQLIQPITVFQVFCTLLWMMDEYWQYSLFSGVMIFLFEAVTVFGRMKSMSVIRGMSSQTRFVNVKRNNAWSLLSTDKLLPGDLISLKVGEGDSTVPCDCLLLKGISVVNEASLTGESHPQLKEELSLLSDDQADTLLDLHGTHKFNTFFGGTTLLQHKYFKDTLVESEVGGNEEDGVSRENEKPPSPTPDEGCLCLVLRTGFNSSQGKLVSMIENSTEEVRDDNFDSLFLVIFLLIFALVASGYVLKKGLENKDRSNFELLLHCIMIVTCVIPPSLPMQTAMAVNSAVLTLMKLNIFCTEPFRIPAAGKVDICLFDKTGTITSDQLAALGMVINRDNKEGVHELESISKASYEASIILGTCHALMSIDGKISGDPLEEASIKAVQFSFDSTTNKCFPIIPKDKDGKDLLNRVWSKEFNEKKVFTEIIHRNHFSSKLQRMSVVARVHDGVSAKIYSLVKGSPEIIETLLGAEKPKWYWDTYNDLTRRGMRIIALACKKINTDNMSLAELSKLPRSFAESDLHFIGFIAFRCLVRKDSKDVLMQLKNSSHQLMMITGDAVLTASYVADEVGIVVAQRVLVLENKEGTEELIWSKEKKTFPYTGFQDFDKFSEKYDICVSGKSLSLAIKKEPNQIFQFVNKIKIFARMVPELKELVIKKLKENGFSCLMCGDGANDVGALRQSNVGVALLSGFGSLNVEKSLTKADEKPKISAEEQKKLDALKLAEDREILAAAQKKRLEEVELKKQLMMKKIEDEVKLRTERDETCAGMRACFSVCKREFSEARATAVADGKKGLAGNNQMKQTLEQYLNEVETDVPMIKLGDASIASPFTSKVPSIQSVVDIIRQGRCALVTRIQMYQILALNCLISAYSLSVLYLDGIKYGDQQMFASGILLTISFLTLSSSSPLKELGKERPFLSIFQPALFLSLIGQIIIHTMVMWYSTQLAKEFSPNWKPQIGMKFEPNLLNSIVFLVSTVQSVSVFAVNYKGRPFMESMTDKPALLYSLGACIVGVVLATSESLPVLNKVLQLVSLPSAEFGEKNYVCSHL
jgi:cation-transporting ATPase 13A1